MTTLTMPQRLLRPMATHLARRPVVAGLATGLAAGMVALVGASLAVGIATAGSIMPGVRVAGVDVGGLDRAGAEARLVAQLPSLSTGRATLVVGEIEQVIPYADLGRGYDHRAMAEAAFAVARGGNPLAEGIGRLRSLVHATALPALVGGHDETVLNRIAATLAERAEIAPVDATVVSDGRRFAVTASRDGRALDPDRVSDALAAFLATADPADVRIRIQPRVVEPQVTSADAWRASRDATRTSRGLMLTIPGAPDGEERDPALTFRPATIASWISFGATDDAEYGIRIDEAAILAAVQALAPVIDQEPVNAGFEVAGAGLGGVTPAQDGRQLQVEESTASVIAALEGRAGGTAKGAVLLDVTIEEPALSTAAAEAALPNMQLVSSWTTNYVPGIANGWGANISIPAATLDGTTVAPGDWFSFWGGVEPITTARGYTYGGAIINGRSEPTGALAGGICSASTTLFNAAMRFGLEIGERWQHYYYIDRYPIGLDASVFQSDAGGVYDMTFRNDTENPLVIRGYGSPGRVTFQIWSVPNGRTVALSDPYTTNYRGAIDTTRVDPSMAPGTSQRIEFPHDGFQATVTRTVYDADGQVLHENVWFSDYKVVNGVVVTGPGATGASAGGDPGTGGGGEGDEPPDPQP